MEGWEAVAGLFGNDTLLIEGLAEWCVCCVWCVENEKAEIESRRELAREVIQELPSLSASMSSVANEGRGAFSSMGCAGGHGFLISLRAVRLRLMVKRVPMRQPNATVLKIATDEEYAASPIKKLDTPLPASTPAIAVEVTARIEVGAQSNQ